MRAGENCQYVIVDAINQFWLQRNFRDLPGNLFSGHFTPKCTINSATS